MIQRLMLFAKMVLPGHVFGDADRHHSIFPQWL